jgi:hydroxymethylpyrimidine pyrophosphatase-like HAD family hydrolase
LVEEFFEGVEFGEEIFWEFDPDEVVAVLDGDNDIAMGSPPATKRTVIVEIGA